MGKMLYTFTGIENVEMPLQLSPRQNEVAELIKKREKDIIILIGAIGTSKTFTQSIIMHSLMMQYPGSVGGFAKKNMSEIVTGTAFDIMDAADAMNVTDITRMGQPLNFISYSNKSRLQFHELDQTKDRNFNKTKKLQLSFNVIDELDSISEEGFWSSHGRVGRKNNCINCGATPKDVEDGKKCNVAQHKICPAFSLASCNPNDTWVKANIYDPWKKGTLPENIAVVEFTQDDSWLGKAYYKKYENSPSAFRKRYLENSWDYGDDDASLFKYKYLDSAHAQERNKDAIRYASLDVALSGVDRAVACVWEGSMLVDIKILKDKDEKLKTEELGDKFMAYCQEWGVGYQNAICDGVGNGEGVCDWLDEHWGVIKRFKAGATKDPRGEPIGNYDMLRSKVSHLLAQAFERNEAQLFDGCPHLQILKKEATSMEYEETAKMLKVESKQHVKKRIGMSPDIFDSCMMGYFFLAQPQETYRSLVRI